MRRLALGTAAAMVSAALFAMPWSFLTPPSQRLAARPCRAPIPSHVDTYDASRTVTTVFASLAVGLLLGAGSAWALVPKLKDLQTDAAAPRMDCDTRVRQQAEEPSALQEFVQASAQRRSEKRLKLIQKRLKEHGRVAIDRICFEGEQDRSMRNM